MTLSRFIILSVPACAALLAGFSGLAWADGSPAKEAARALVGEVQRRERSDAEDGLADWTRLVIGGALDRAGHAARDGDPNTSPFPLAAERNAVRMARGFAARGNTGEVLVFMSLSAPPESWRQWAAEATRIGAPIVLRGVMKEGLRATAGRVGGLLDGAEAGVAIDPRLFRLFRIELVPALAVVPGGVPPCKSRGCADGPPPPFDLVTGNIGLAAALEAVAAEGGPGRDAARRALARLRGGWK